MEKYIPLSPLVAEIERLRLEHTSKEYCDEAALVLEDLEDLIDTLEVKEFDLENTTDAMIGLPYENKDGGYTHLVDVSRPLPVGKNKIAIIFKED